MPLQKSRIKCDLGFFSEKMNSVYVSLGYSLLSTSDCSEGVAAFYGAEDRRKSNHSDPDPGKLILSLPYLVSTSQNGSTM